MYIHTYTCKHIYIYIHNYIYLYVYHPSKVAQRSKSSPLPGRLVLGSAYGVVSKGGFQKRNIYIYISLSLYIYIYVYIYIYIYVYIYIYRERERERCVIASCVCVTSAGCHVVSSPDGCLAALAAWPPGRLAAWPPGCPGRLAA